LESGGELDSGHEARNDKVERPAMIPAKIAGAIILGVPLTLVAYAALWRRQRPVFWFALALILVGLGYLMATGAADDIARSIVPAPVLQPAG
jgi:dipeptide/tripeptide permease